MTFHDTLHEFNEAIEAFKAGLNNDETFKTLITFTNIDEVYQLVDNLQQQQRENGHLRHLCRIQPYLDRLRDYTKAIDTFVQVYPQILALVFGPIKLLLQWSSIVTKSLDEILDTLVDIGAVFPVFSGQMGMFASSERMQRLYALLFKDILEFYRICLKFFSMSSSKHVLEALWPRKRDKIAQVKKRIENHMSSMRDEVCFEHIRDGHDTHLMAVEAFHNSERANRLQEFLAIKIDISPRSYDDKLNWYHGRVCAGTGTWLLKNEVFKDWLDAVGDERERILWLQGIPGAGKTFLWGTVVDHAMTIGPTAFAFLDHESSSSTSALTIVHSLIFQLASQNDNLQDVIRQSARQQLKSILNVAVKVLRSILHCVGRAFVIIDGVDEIDEIERNRLLNSFLELSRDCHETRIFVSSRQDALILRLLQDRARSIRVDQKNTERIQNIVQYSEDGIYTDNI